MKGMELARGYYQTYGEAMLEKLFPDYIQRIAVGLVGQGSECFGFDDEISRDHDFGPSFCMWLTDEDYEKIGKQLEREYQKMPGEFGGAMARRVSQHGGGRVGVLRTSSFYRMFTGHAAGPRSLPEWLRIPEHYLAAATNGEVFRDDLGDFSTVRERLKSYYPEEVRRKKIAARAAAMAQSGQYNYARMMQRKEVVSARMALTEFTEKTISMVHLLNSSYMPFYKWAFTSMKGLKRLITIGPLLVELSRESLDTGVWEKGTVQKWRYKRNEKDRHVVLIEGICREVASELRMQGICKSRADFLDVQAHEIMEGLEDAALAKCHILEG